MFLACESLFNTGARAKVRVTTHT